MTNYNTTIDVTTQNSENATNTDTTALDINGPNDAISIWTLSKKGQILTETSKVLGKYVGIFILVLGVVGNMVSIAVFCRKRLRSLQMTIFLCTLAVVDLLLIIFGQEVSPIGAFDLNLVNTSRVACKLFYLLVPVLRVSSVWLLTGVTIERCIAITLPMWVKSGRAGGPKAIYCYIVTIFICSFAYQCHSFVLFDIILSNNGSMLCDPVVSKSPIFIRYIRPWLAISFNAIIPFLIILMCNTIILVAIRRSLRSFSKGNADKTGRDPNTRSMVAMLLTIGFVFLLLNLPLGVVMMLTRIYPPSFWWGSADQAAASDFMWTLAVTALYLNSAINFILYVISGHLFRGEMVAMFREIFTRCHCWFSPTSGTDTSIDQSLDTSLQQLGPESTE